ncbi:MAG TPA: M14 family zinc carboxypeptidase [Nocardioidaceae bacterium]|nr:M14 family zinc carboxypeptidase [Nocardioidaceae bacterium]
MTRSRTVAIAVSMLFSMASPVASAGAPSSADPVRAATSDATRPGNAASNAEAAVLHRVLIGRSVQGRPIWAYRKGNPQGTNTVVVVGQMHGDERAGVRTARYIRERVPVARNSKVWIVPTMNPDGLAADTRRNARDVDLNRNWPTRWEPGDGAGSRALSEPETRAMFRFLTRVQPRFIVSLHQPFGVVGLSDKNPRFVRRLSAELNLPVARVQIGDCTGPDCPPVPTMTSWYNARRPGFCVTVEFPAHPTRQYLTARAGPGILRATFAWRRVR